MVPFLFKLLKAISLLLLTTVVCLLIGLSVFIFVLDDNQRSHLITLGVSKCTDVEIAAKKIGISYHDGAVRINADQLSLASQKKPISLQVKRAEITVPFSAIIAPPLFITSIVLDSPTVDLSKQPLKEWFSAEKKKNRFTPHLFNLCNIDAKNGTVKLPQKTDISNIAFNTTLETKDLRHINLQGNGHWQHSTIPFSIKGTIKSFTRIDTLDLQLAASAIPLDGIRLSSRLKINRATAALRGTISSDPKDNSLHLQANLNLSDVLFTLSKSQKTKRYKFKHLSAQIAAEYADGEFILHPSSLENDAVQLGLSGRFDPKPDSPYISFQAHSNKITIDDLKRFIPDPFLSRWLTTELFPIFTNGNAVINRLNLEGSWEELKNMAEPENRNCFDLDLTLTDTDIVLAKPETVFRNSSAKLTISSGRLLVSDIQGATQQTHVQLGLYQIDDLYADELLSRFGIKGTSTVSDLVRISSSPLLPAKLRKDSLLLDNYTGQVEADILAHYSPSYKTIRFDRFDTRLIKIISKKKIQDSPVTFPEITISRTDQASNSVIGTGRWKETDFQLSGFFFDDATGKVTINSLLDLTTLFPFIKPEQFPPGLIDTEQVFPIIAEIRREADGFFLNAQTELPQLDHILCSTSKRPLTNGYLGINLTTKDWQTLTVDKLTLSYDQYILQGKGKADLETMKMAIKINSPEQVIYYDAQGEKEKEKRKGPLEADLLVDIDVNYPEQSKMTGQLRAQDLTFALPWLASPLVNTSFDLRFSGRRVDLHTSSFWLKQNLLGSPLQMQGFLKMDQKLNGVLLIKGEYVHFRDIYKAPEEKTDEDKELQVEHALTNKYGIVINAKIKKLDLGGILISPFNFRGFSTNSSFYPVMMSARLENGRIGMLTDVEENEEENLQFYFFLENQDIRGLNQFFPNLEKREINGTITTGGVIHSQGNSFQKLRSKLSGDVAFRIQKATLKGNFVLVRLLELMSIENLFSDKAEYAKDGDLYIKSVNGSFSIKDSVLTSEDILINTFAFDATGVVEIDLHDNSVTSHLAVSPFGAVDTIINTIPIIGHILTGKKKSLVSYNFKITGKIPDVDITYVPLEDLPQSLLGYGVRLLTPSTYLFFLPKSKKGRNYDRLSEDLVAEVEQSFESDQDLLKEPGSNN